MADENIFQPNYNIYAYLIQNNNNKTGNTFPKYLDLYMIWVLIHRMGMRTSGSYRNRGKTSPLPFPWR